MTWAIGCAIGFFTIGVLLWRTTIHAERLHHLEDLLPPGPNPYDIERELGHDPWPDWARRTLADIWTLP